MALRKRTAKKALLLSFGAISNKITRLKHSGRIGRKVRIYYVERNEMDGAMIFILSPPMYAIIQGPV